MDVTFAITRLITRMAGLGLKTIGGSADLDAAMEGTVSVPSLYVMPLAESADANILIGANAQRITQAFGVVLVVANRRDATGKAALQDLAALRTPLRDALVGWAPVPENGEQIQYSAGRLLKFDDGRLWWADDFALKTYYRSPN